MNLKGKTVVFTGKISVTRDQAWALVEKAGGVAGLDVSGRTDVLVVGDKPGSKLARANSLSIKVMTEKEFFASLKVEEEVLDEEPLTKEQIEEYNSHLVELKCDWCGSIYKQHDSYPDYNTCISCEISSKPRCPNCGDKRNPVFVTDYNNYYCRLCGKFFKAPYSLDVEYTKHIHVNDLKGKCIFCGRKEASIFGKIHMGKVMLAKQELEKERLQKDRTEKLESDRKEVEVIRSYLSSLTPEQMEELRRQYD